MEFEPAPFFFYRCSVRKYKSPGHVTVPVPHIPFATRSGAMQSPGRSGISLYRFIRTVRCGAFSASCVGSLCRFACGKCRADDCRPLSCAGRALLCLAGTFMVRIRLGRSGVRCRSAAVRRVRDGRKIGPDRPFPLVGSQCRVSGRPVSGPKVRMCKKLREALGLPGASAGRPYGTEPLLRGDGRPALSVSLF